MPLCFACDDAGYQTIWSGISKVRHPCSCAAGVDRVMASCSFQKTCECEFCLKEKAVAMLARGEVEEGRR